MVRDGVTKEAFEITVGDPLVSILVNIEHEMCVEMGFYTLSFPHFITKSTTAIISSHRDYVMCIDYHMRSNVVVGFTSMDLTLTRMETWTEDQLDANAIAKFIVAEAADYVGAGLGGPSGGVEGGGNVDGEQSEDDLLGNDGGCGGGRGGSRDGGCGNRHG
uniref:Uncharacterized protein n=1 Tax=Tanacetum cinerariifolium TaxID=118510 RepID=A0A6L2P5M0_TANCI|nr:hypothetical protein [Tanacetum cinerariifolium]